MSWRTTWAPSTEPRPAGSERGPRPGQPPGTQAHTGQTGCRGRRLASDPGSRGHPVPTDRGGLVAGQHPFVWKGSLYLRFCIYTWCKCTYIETLSVQTLTTPPASPDGPEKGSHSGPSSQQKLSSLPGATGGSRGPHGLASRDGQRVGFRRSEGPAVPQAPHSPQSTVWSRCTCDESCSWLPSRHFRGIVCNVVKVQ